MGTKQYDSATDLLTFSRASGGTALRRVGYGAELVTNGTFESDTDWSLASTWSVGSGTLNYAGSGNNTAKQTNVFEIGKMYLVSAEMVAGAGTAQIYSGTGGSRTGHDVLEFTSVGTYSRFVLATATSLIIRRAGGTSFSIDNVSVKEVIFDRATDPLVLFNHPANIPRIEYDAAGAVKGLLIEEARTNLLTHSNDFTNAVWINTNNSNTANAGVSPDGTSNANKVVPTVSSGIHYTYRDVNFPYADHSFSVYVASAGYGFATICAGSNAFGDYYAVVIDLSDGTQTALYSQGTHSKTVTVEPVGSYYRVTISGNGERYYVVGASDTGTYTPSNYGFKSFSGDGTSGILVYGAQAEAGAFPTSYIPTTGATATRAVDVALIPTSAFGFNSEAMTVVVNCSGMSFAGASYPRLWEIGSSINSQDRINVFLKSADGNFGAGFVTANVDESSFTLGTGNTTPTAQVKIAYALKENDIAAVQDVGLLRTDSSATLTGGNPRTLLGLGISTVYSSSPLNGHIKSIQYYPRRLTNAQLQELTT